MKLIVLLALTLDCSGSQVRDRADETGQASELAGCIAKAKALDGTAAERWALYTRCADVVDAKHGKT